MELGCCPTTKERGEGEDEIGVAWAPAAANSGSKQGEQQHMTWSVQRMALANKQQAALKQSYR
jgi:hypothetical protein